VLELKRGRGASAAALGVTALVYKAAAAAAATACGCIMCSARCKSGSWFAPSETVDGDNEVRFAFVLALVGDSCLPGSMLACN